VKTYKMRPSMMLARFFCAMVLAINAALWCPRVAAQVQTEAPPVVPGAKPVTVEHVKVHGASLAGNLEGDAADSAARRSERERASVSKLTSVEALSSCP
jgi:hypothetical protein